MKNYIYGLHAVIVALQKNPAQVKTIYLQKGRDDKRVRELIALAEGSQISIQTMDKKRLDTITDQHQGVIAEIVAQQRYSEQDLPALLESIDGNLFILILDGITDPHNLGAILRSADAAGVHAVIATKDHAAGITPVVRKVACGAAETVPFFQVTNLARTMTQLKERGIWFYGTDDKASSTIYAQQFDGHVGLVLGAEGTGMRRLTQEHCDYTVSLPMAGHVSSLNVSVAAGVCLFEIVRQRSLLSK